MANSLTIKGESDETVGPSQAFKQAKDLFSLVKEHQAINARAYGFGKPLTTEEKDVEDMLWGQNLPKEIELLRTLIQSLVSDPAEDFESLRVMIEEMRTSGIAIGDLRKRLERTRLPKIVRSHQNIAV